MVLGQRFTEKSAWGKMSMSIFQFIEQFYFQCDVFKLQEVVSELAIKVYQETNVQIRSQRTKIIQESLIFF
jgi:hypothetical protein